MNSYFDEIGSLIEHRWFRTGQRLIDFSRCAADVLCERPAYQVVDTWQYVRHMCGGVETDVNPAGVNSVGNTLVVHTSRWLNITLTFSFDTILPLHHHSWAGAFQVLEGASVTRECRFVEEEIVDPSFRFGRFEDARVRCLFPGDTVEVAAGDGFVHGIAHLARPSVALTVRRRVQSDDQTHNYWRPGLSVRTLVTEELVRDLRGALDWISRAEGGQSVRTAAESVGAFGDPRIVFWLAESFIVKGEDDPMWAMLHAFADRRPELACRLRAAIQERMRHQALVRLRKSPFGQNHRALLAALAYCDDGQQVQAVLSALGHAEAEIEIRELGRHVGFRSEMLAELVRPWTESARRAS